MKILRLIEVLIFGILIYPGNPARAQVVNDNIEDRIELQLNQPILSNTSNCTLQWECINKDLTTKCIQYHNDQWFYFNTMEKNRLFLNISSQECRDLRGVQIIVIDGTPCIPETYEIVQCVSLGNHNDVFIELDQLKLNESYLVQVDGYLHDFCAFEIEVSDAPKGLPLEVNSITPVQTDLLEGQNASIKWKVTDSVAVHIDTYEIWRRHESEFKSNLVHELSQNFNSYGTPKLQYMAEDYLPEYGIFYYNIVGVGDNQRILISKFAVQNIMPEQLREKEKSWIVVDLNYPADCRLKISMFDVKNQELLNYFTFNYSIENQTFKTYVKDYLDQGIKDYRLQIEHLNSGAKQNYWFKK